jgi:hypothetical protein
MIDRTALLRDLQREVKAFEGDLRKRALADQATDAHVRREHDAARAAGRTADPFELWREDQITQSAVAWVLACVFVRFLEDNELLPEPLVSGPGSRRQLALDHRQLFFRAHPTDTDREYLHDVFRMVAKLPAAGDVIGDKHNPLWSLAPSGDGATRLLEFFHRVPPETGELAHDFTDPEWNTRFLGDLYQDLSEAARKKFALLQTPEFVEEFILDRTLTPAIAEFGYKEVRLIDPTCGSGHFLLGAFWRLFELYLRQEPGINPRELAQRALDQVAGVDVNPFAVAIARFRLLLAALKASRIGRLTDAPGFLMHLAVGDSLLHGRRFGLANMNLQPKLVGDDPLRRHVYEAEDADALTEILGRQYHAVVGNPPYITVKDRALNQAYRNSYPSCHKKYSLGVPFTERFFELAVAGDDRRPAGFIGMITTKSFMKREFGKKLIEERLPKLDLTHVIDTSGARIPGHGTPTAILFGRNRAPIGDDIRTVMGIRGELETPKNPAGGKVWRAIIEQLDTPGSESEFISVADYSRERFMRHPWSLGGGGAAELKILIDSAGEKRLGDVVESIGFMAITGEDDAFVGPRHVFDRDGIPWRDFGTGDLVRDWAFREEDVVAFPYEDDSTELRPVDLKAIQGFWQRCWRLRTNLRNRLMFGKLPEESGLAWYEYRFFAKDRYRSPLIVFAEVATHNHFAFDRGGKVFKQTAPVIKLPPASSEQDNLALLAFLNSSTACFWMRQVSQPKTQTTGMDQDAWRVRHQFDGTKLKEMPVVSHAWRDLANRLDQAARDRGEFAWAVGNCGIRPTSQSIRDAGEWLQRRRAQMIALQEELDWAFYQTFGILDGKFSATTEVPPLHPAERAFAIVLARELACDDVSTTWFSEHDYEPVVDLPSHWSDDYRRLVERRIAVIESDRNVHLIEQPEYKRRWNSEPFEEVKHRMLRSWLLDRLEDPRNWPGAELQTTARLADRARQDDDFMRVAELYTGRPDFEVAELTRDLVADESVPALPACLYTPSGLRKREQWERTWERQRHEDELDSRSRLESFDPRHLTEDAATALKAKEIGDIPTPPKYTRADFLKNGYWRLRDKLDVPKERFVSFPHCEREADPSLVVAWGGWDHLQLAQATAAYYVAMKDTEGWGRERLTPLLAIIAELVPWLRQWHNELDPEYGVGMGDYFGNFLDGETRGLGLTPLDLTAWTPPNGNAAQRKRAKHKTV